MATELTKTDDAFDVKAEVLLADLSRVAERKFRMNRWFRPLFCISGLYFLGYGLYVTLLHLPVSDAYSRTLALFSNVALGIISLSWMPEAFLSKRVAKGKARLKILVDGLGKDSRAVGALAQLYRSNEVLSVADIALDPLLKLLPDVKAGDARYFSDNQMEALLDLLIVRRQDRGSERCKALPLAALKALEQIGDSRAIEPVRRLTTGRSNHQYRQAARECLTVLEQYGEERDRDRFLLLPSSVEVGKETLLRATIPEIETQPALLLRAVRGEERE
jgi:hypothetical protein